MEAHSFAAGEADPETYAVATMPIIRRFVSGHNGVSEDEARGWEAEQRELGDRGEFYFACIQFCFTATRSA
jgi:arsenite methyltransferase